MNQTTTKKGFTIIEVVLVLAIAGLIFLMVFLALPALQRSQRDTQRKNDISRLQAAINDYKSANRGKLPANNADLQTVITNYVKQGNSTFLDPSTNEQYTVQLSTNNGQAVKAGTILYYQHANCGDNGVAQEGNGPVLRAGLEGQNIAYCLQA